MEILTQLANTVGLDPLLWPLAAALGFGLVFARASVPWFNAAHTFGTSVLAGVVLGALKLTMPQHSQMLSQVGWQGVVLQGFIMGLVAFGTSYGLPAVLARFGLPALSPANNSRTKEN